MFVKKILFLFFIFLFCNSFVLAEKIDPNFKWKLIKTEHFKFYYHDEIKHRVAEYVNVAEATYLKLTQKFNTYPTFRTTVVLIDSTDLSNGSAGPLPWATNTLYTINPQIDTSLSYFKNWVEGLITHELTHTLNFEYSKGYSSVIRYMFGRHILGFPHAFTPIWISEGIAVHTESLAGYGRNNNSLINMVLREDLLSDYDRSLHDISFYFRRWPLGIVPYNYGGRFIKFLESKYGDGKFNKIIEEQADNWIIPFLHYKNAVDVFGQSYQPLWEEWKQEERLKANQLQESIIKNGITSYIKITNTGFRNSLPRFNNQGNKIYYIRNNNYEYSKLMQVNIPNTQNWQTFQNQKHNELVRAAGATDGSLTVAPTDDIYFTQVLPYRNYNTYFDVSLYSQKSIYSKITNRPQRLTKGERISYIDISKDGKLFIFIKTKKSNIQSLIISDTNFKNQSILINDVSAYTLAHCQFSFDNSKIVFSFRDNLNFQTGIALYDLKTSKIITLIKDNYQNLHPTWLPNNEGVLFSSDRSNGIFNLHYINFSQNQIIRITNFVSGIFSPNISPNHQWITATLYSNKGYDIIILKYPKETFESTSYQTQDDTQQFITTKVDIDKLHKDIDTKYKSKWANPFPYLLPSSWEPFSTLLYNTNNVGYQIGLTGKDVLDKHRYSLNLIHSIQQRNIILDINYKYSGLWSDIIFSYYNEDITYGKKFQLAPSLSQIFGIDFRVPLLSGATISHTIGIKYQYIYSNFYAIDLIAPSFSYLLLKHQTKLSLYYNYNDTSLYSKSISPENGRLFGFIVSSRGAYNYQSFSLLYSGFYYEHLPSFWKNHVIKIGAKAEYIQSFSSYYEFLFVNNLRGFRNSLYNIVGTKAGVATLQYSLPLWQPDIGNYHIGLSLSDIYMNLYFDYGYLWGTTEIFPIQKFNKIFGIEIGINTMILYSQSPLNLLIGYAYNIDDSKLITNNWGQLYLSLSGNFDGGGISKYPEIIAKQQKNTQLFDRNISASVY